MPLTVILWAILAPSAAVLVIFIGWSALVRVPYYFSNLSRTSFKINGGMAKEIPKVALKPWLATLRVKWKKSPFKTSISVLSETFFYFLALLLTFASCALATLLIIFPLSFALSLQELAAPLKLFRIIALIGGLVGLLFLFQIIFYYSHRTVKKGRLAPPIIPLPRGEIGAVVRMNFLRSAYLFNRLQIGIGISPFLGSASILIASKQDAAGNLLPPDRIGNTSENNEQSSIYLGLILVGWAIAMAVAEILSRLVNFRMPAQYAVANLNKLLNWESENERSAKQTLGIFDPFGSRRTQMEKSIRSTEILARRLDLVRNDHPVASIIFGCARYMRKFLTRTESMSGKIPIEIQKAMRDTIAVIAGASHPDFLKQAGKSVDAFEADGTPISSLRTKKLGRWASLFTRFSDSTEKYARLGNAAWTITLLLIIIFLSIRGDLDLTKIQIQK